MSFSKLVTSLRIAPRRRDVIDNIRMHTKTGAFHAKAEVGDPSFSKTMHKEVLSRHLESRKTIRYWVRNFAARRLTDIFTWKINTETKIIGMEYIKTVTSGAIITSNHFNPDDNTVIRRFVQKAGKRRLYIISRDTNLAMPGLIGFLMNYSDTIPISKDEEYMTTRFEELLSSVLERKQFVLMYPEQEMWFNYRKPRPLKRGAYRYAAKNRVPVIPCFVEITDTCEKETEEFWKVRYTLHILEPIYPDPAKTVEENAVYMREKDYARKKRAYERAYGKPLDYTFSAEDIAGLIRP